MKFIHSDRNIGGRERQNTLGRNINPHALLQLRLFAEQLEARVVFDGDFQLAITCRSFVGVLRPGCKYDIRIA